MEPVGVQPTSSRSAWAWVPSLYFAQGIPYSVVMQVATVFYKLMGVPNQTLAYHTSWLNLPWVLKPLWSPFIELLMTKRRCVVAMQVFVAVALGLIAFGVPLSNYFIVTLILFWLIAIGSATHDIAADGFYLMTMPTRDQATFVGVRSTAFRLALIVGQGLVVLLAGTLERASSLPTDQVEVSVAVGPGETLPFETPREIDQTADQQQDMGLRTFQRQLRISSQAANKSAVDSLRKQAKEWNQQHGFTSHPNGPVQSQVQSSRWFGRLELWIQHRFGKKKPASTGDASAANAALVYFYLDAPLMPNERRVVTIRRISGSSDVNVTEGERVEIHSENQPFPFAVLIEGDPRVSTDCGAVFAAQSGNLRQAWFWTFLIISAMFMSLSMYHAWILPISEKDQARGGNFSTIGRGLREVIAGFFAKPGILRVIFFLLFYRFAEAQLVKMVQPFLLDARQTGGLALTTSQVGTIYGVVGVVMLLCGGILGGALAGRDGLRKWFWAMVIAMNAPNVVYWLLAWLQPVSWLWSVLAVGVEQFGYGFGFAAYVLVTMAAARGPHETAHYAFCTGMWALGLMIPGMFSGWLQKLVGYEYFFMWVMIATLPSFMVSMLVPRTLLEQEA